jgi:hypothetical protein
MVEYARRAVAGPARGLIARRPVPQPALPDGGVR